jgi:2-dehydropantoate 2-reductase
VRIAVVGAGALGGFFGGLWARAGEEVAFVARGRTLAALREGGLRVRSRVAGEFALPVAATDDPAALGPVDLVFLGVKTYDLDGAIGTVRPLVGPATAVLCVQNGIEGPERVAAAFGERAVIAGAVYLSATVEAPGAIVQIGDLGSAHLGELAGGRTPRLEALAAAFARIAIPTELHDDVRLPLWRKFMAICAFSGLTALTRLTLAQIFACPETTALYRDAMAEVAAVARAEGIELPEGAADAVLASLTGLAEPPERGSMAYDLLAGRRLELEALNGAVVRRGAAASLATPVNRAIYAALKPFVAGDPDAAPAA